MRIITTFQKISKQTLGQYVRLLGFITLFVFLYELFSCDREWSAWDELKTKQTKHMYEIRRCVIPVFVPYPSVHQSRHCPCPPICIHKQTSVNTPSYSEMHLVWVWSIHQRHAFLSDKQREREQSRSHTIPHACMLSSEDNPNLSWLLSETVLFWYDSGWTTPSDCL